MKQKVINRESIHTNSVQVVGVKGKARLYFAEPFSPVGLTCHGMLRVRTHPFASNRPKSWGYNLRAIDPGYINTPFNLSIGNATDTIRVFIGGAMLTSMANSGVPTGCMALINYLFGTLLEVRTHRLGYSFSRTKAGRATV